jgi:hypothetical protein
LKRSPQPTRRGRNSLGILLASPDADDLTRLLRAWRLWIVGGLLGAILGAAAFAIAPPPYRARATVNVDFHLELAWPQNTDREQFYYLERETRKLVEIAMSDATLEAVSDVSPALTVADLRSGAPARLQLSQPGNGGWHFYVDHRHPDTAALLAAAWARAFVGQVRNELQAGPADSLERFITVAVVQGDPPALERQPSMGMYVIVGAGLALALIGLAILVVRFR